MNADRRDFSSRDIENIKSDNAQLVRPINFITLTPQTALLSKAETNDFPVSLLEVVPPAYKLGVGDALQLIVWNHPEISSPLGQGAGFASATVNNSRIINESGEIFIPYAGEVNVSDLSIKEARVKIADALKKYIQDPQVDIVVTDHASQVVSVTGQVVNPRGVAIRTRPIHLLNVLEEVGGVTPNANIREITLTRGEQKHVLDLEVAAQQGIDLSRLFLLDKDQIHVRDNSSHKVYVMGEINDPEPVLIQPSGLTLMQALSEAGGISQVSADASEIYVIREVTDNSVDANVYHLDASNPIAMLTADSFNLMPRDIVFVGTPDINRFNRVINQILPSFTLYRTLDRLSNDLGL